MGATNRAFLGGQQAAESWLDRVETRGRDHGMTLNAMVKSFALGCSLSEMAHTLSMECVSL